MEKNLQYKHMWVMVVFVSAFACAVIVWAITLPSVFSRIDNEHSQAQTFWGEFTEKIGGIWSGEDGKVEGVRVDTQYSPDLLDRLEKKVRGE